MKRKVIAIIPAKKTSERLPGKNSIYFNKTNLLGIAINKALDSKIFDSVFVSSDDIRTMNNAWMYGANTYRRSKELSENKDAKIIDVLKEQVIVSEYSNDTIIGIACTTSPLSICSDIEKAYILFKQYDFAYQVVSVTKYEKPATQALIISNGNSLMPNILTPQFPLDYDSNSKKHRDSYRYNCAIVFMTVEMIKRQKELLSYNAVPYIMPLDRGLDIDYKYQLDLAEKIVRGS